jgi:hypothetical protein
VLDLLVAAGAELGEAAKRARAELVGLGGQIDGRGPGFQRGRVSVAAMSWCILV